MFLEVNYDIGFELEGTTKTITLFHKSQLKLIIYHSLKIQLHYESEYELQVHGER